MKIKNEITENEIELYRTELRKLSNSAQYAKAYRFAKSLVKKYPKILIFAYYEAVMIAEDDFNFTPKQVEARFKNAAKKLKPLLKRTRGTPLILRHGLKNEYYWFSKQPYKQYQLGIKAQKIGPKRGACYSQGVGAAMLAKQYGLIGNKKVALIWAKKSEQAWLKFFKIDSRWYNSYFFYAMSLAYQNRLKECDKAFSKAAKIAKKSENWKAIRKEKKEIMKVHKMMYS